MPVAHIVPIGCLRQAPCPSHVPSLPHVSGASVEHAPARGLSPAGTNEHVPIESCVLHDLHVSSHAVLQQTPSTQKPDSQSFAQAHACPLTLRAPASEHVTAPLPSPGLSPPPAPPSSPRVGRAALPSYCRCPATRTRERRAHRKEATLGRREIFCYPSGCIV
jgi:hypothetical protein